MFEHGPLRQRRGFVFAFQDREDLGQRLLLGVGCGWHAHRSPLDFLRNQVDCSSADPSAESPWSASSASFFGLDSASASLMRRLTSMLFFTPLSISNRTVGVKRVFI